ncbi:MAG: Gfo/Idh/MocA family oxidoreductase [Anaerolineales bacterium]|jgi:predicted dehydrogenase|uniref:Gfo/Idh/MocA family protein n=3 Tax=Candidatus Villigracilaceae TaxID=3140589 RepID=UPI001B5D8DF6|nr:Gfo/Idh/MocA family oxidoreductase [Anaerolineales bacterium]MBK9603645.1 Gfo/Idh/MocA family oxidoreductase [Anaerolineales bacterium]MBL0344284.1 Gfo/Idh/MocA family oxidoreductase [Anaerolineales bacterium]MBP8047257.1 Gfo/Idh/MocA family oxidoreductase [Anaerolineales bacterium]
MTAVKVGIIGYGYWGPNLTRNFYELPNAELTAIADLSDERLKQAAMKYPHVAVRHDHHELFDLGLDAVVIATPPITHYSIAKECLEHNLHVFVEKPITLKSEHARELIELADSKGLILMVGHIFEYNSAVHALKKYIDSGELGDIYYLDTARLSLGLFQRDSNVIWDLAPHDISILLYLLGKKPISVSAQGTPCVFENIFDVAYLNMVFPGNIPAYIHVSWLDPCKVRRITVVGSKKMAVYNDVENEQKIKIYDKGVDRPEYTNGGFGEFHCNYHSGDITIPTIRFVEPLKQECQHFIDCIVNHTKPTSSGREGMDVVKILETAQLSMSNGHGHEVITW